MGLSSITEGICPEHDTPLERRDDCGWCDECGVGYSMTWDEGEGEGTMSVHMDFSGFKLTMGAGTTRSSGPGRALFTRPA